MRVVLEPEASPPADVLKYFHFFAAAGTIAAATSAVWRALKTRKDSERYVSECASAESRADLKREVKRRVDRALASVEGVSLDMSTIRFRNNFLTVKLDVSNAGRCFDLKEMHRSLASYDLRLALFASTFEDSRDVVVVMDYVTPVKFRTVLLWTLLLLSLLYISVLKYNPMLVLGNEEEEEACDADDA